MTRRRNWIAVTVVIFGLIMFIPDAQAQRQEFEYTSCTANNYNFVSRIKLFPPARDHLNSPPCRVEGLRF
jgi:hypothetical protein